jgi:hypothetical protein
MEELERRLRSALTELAEEVSPSHNAWIEHERRLALKSRRARVRPALMAAVAAAVVALIAVPVMILNLKPSGTDQGAIPTSDSSPSPGPPPSASATTSYRYTPIAGEQLLTEPYLVASTNKGGGDYWDVLVYTVYQDRLKSTLLCSVVLPPGASVNGVEQKAAADPTCSLLKPPAKRLLWYQGYVPNGEGVYIFVMSPPVQSVLAWNDTSGYVLANPIGATKDFVVLKVGIGPKPPKQYTARDANKATLENG